MPAKGRDDGQDAPQPPPPASPGRPVMRTRFRHAALAALVSLLAPALALAQGKTRLNVYSTLEQEYIDGFRKAFEADNPDVEIAFLRDSTGVITARLQSEKERPQADAAWGLAVTSMLVLDKD